jgi:uncharacterized protein YjbI with pentapeptide repeats
MVEYAINVRVAGIQTVLLENNELNNKKLYGTIFHHNGMKGTSFRNAVLMSVTIKSDVKKVIFDGASMDKLTYALLKAVRQILIM